MEGLRALHPGWDLHLLAAGAGPFTSRAADLGVTVHVLPFPPAFAQLGDGKPFEALRSVGAVLRYRRDLQAAVDQICPDLIHTNGFKMHLLGAWLSGTGSDGAVTRVCQMHDYVSGRRVAGSLLRLSAARFDAVVANSRSVAMNLSKFRGCRGRLRFIHNGVNMARFSGSGGRLDLDRMSGLPAAAENVIRVGLMGTYARWKGHFTFLRALSLLPEDLPVRGYVIGGPVYQTAGSQHTFAGLRAEAVRLGVAGKTGFTGMVDETPAAYRALDIVVHASTSPEPFGMVLIEAMSCGKPVIASHAGGAKEVIDDEVSGLAHTPGDAEALARQIVRLAADSGLRCRLGENGRASVTRSFQAEVMAKKFADLYREVTGGKIKGNAKQAVAEPRTGKRCSALA